jgi:putative redox protein
MSFELHGNIEVEKAKRAVSLSIEKYCSVAETLRRGGTEITWNVKVINSDQVKG